MIQLRQRPNRVRSFYDDAAHYPALSQRAVGVQSVPTDQIVGSVGRHQELRSDFLRAHKRLGFPRETNRFWSVYNALEEGVILPPIELFHLDGRYYVLDGNHRVAAALRFGQLEMDAVVTEYQPQGEPRDTSISLVRAPAA